MRAFIVSVCVLLPLGALSGRAQSADGPQEMLRAAQLSLKAQEELVRNLTVSAKSQSWTWDDKRQALVASGEIDATLICEGVPNGRAKLDVPKALSPWIDGPAPFSMDAYTASYDGRIGIVYTTKSGDFTKPVKISEAVIFGKRPPPLALDFVGRMDTIFGFTERQQIDGRRFSSFLEQEGTTLTPELVVDGGKSFLKVTREAHVGKATSNIAKHEFWFDPHRNYAIARALEYRVTVVEGKFVGFSAEPMYEDRVTDFWEAAPNVFYPKHVESEYFGKPKDGKRFVLSRVLLDVTSVKANDPDVNDETFKIAIPKGAWVRDQTSGREFKLEGTADEQAKEIEEVVRAARATAAEEPDTRPGAVQGK